jgi:hypothetical protein
MESTVRYLMDCLTDALPHVHNIEMREHIKMYVRMAQSDLDYVKQLELERGLERAEEYAQYMVEANQP